MRAKRLILSIGMAVALVGCAIPITHDEQLVETAYQHIIDREWNEAEPYLLEALEENEDNPYAVLNLGVVYQQTGRDIEAREMYNRVIEMDPSNLAIRTNVGVDRGRTLTALAKRNIERMDEAAAYYR